MGQDVVLNQCKAVRQHRHQRTTGGIITGPAGAFDPQAQITQGQGTHRVGGRFQCVRHIDRIVKLAGLDGIPDAADLIGGMF